MSTNYSLTRPQIKGNIKETSFRTLGVGYSDVLLFIGHADANVMYEPYQVTDIKKAVNFLKADVNSPLLRALLEAYDGGAKDIWLYPAAPMSEYEPFTASRLDVRSDWDSKNFYEKYYDRLTDAYANLLDRDIYRIVTPLEAPHYYTGGIDFTSQLVDFCGDFFSSTGSVCLGVIGTKIENLDTSTIEVLISDSRLSNLDSNSKFVMVVLGEGVNYIPQTSTSYSAPLSTQVAIAMSLLPLNRSTVGIRLSSTLSLVGRNFSDDEMGLLASNKINPVIRSKRGKRGGSYQTFLMTDNTLAVDGSSYWAMSQIRSASFCLNQIREFGYQYIGASNGFQGLRAAIDKYLKLLVNNGLIMGYTFDMRDSLDHTKAYVDVGIKPFYSLKSIYFTVEVGPGS